MKENLTNNLSQRVADRVNEAIILNESGFQRLNSIFNGQINAIRSVAILTAENPMGGDLRPKSGDPNININIRLMSLLKDYLKRGNYGYVKIKGNYGFLENSVIIMNIERDDAIAIGKNFRQQAIIWGERENKNGNIGIDFEWIEGDTTTQHRFVALHGPETQKLTDFYSIKDSHKFVIPFFDDMYKDVRPKDLQSNDIQISNNEGISINKQLSNKIIERVGRMVTKRGSRSGSSQWGNRGMFLEYLKQENACLFD